MKFHEYPHSLVGFPTGGRREGVGEERRVREGRGAAPRPLNRLPTRRRERARSGPPRRPPSRPRRPRPRKNRKPRKRRKPRRSRPPRRPPRRSRPRTRRSRRPQTPPPRRRKTPPPLRQPLCGNQISGAPRGLSDNSRDTLTQWLISTQVCQEGRGSQSLRRLEGRRRAEGVTCVEIEIQAPHAPARCRGASTASIP